MHDVQAVELLLEQLAIPHRWQLARRELFLRRDAREAFLLGLVHEEPSVRAVCALALDHLADERSFPALIEALDDPAPQVRMHALHALSCDRCKTDGVCPPSASQLLPRAIDLLLHDENSHVHAHAVGPVGNYVHDDARALTALRHAREHDPAPMVRKKSSWYLPGGPVFLRTRPKPARVARSA